MLGRLLDGRYQVIQVLSSGGFGETYITEDNKRPGKPRCVVKHLKPANNDPNYLQIARRLFISEAEILEKLGNHSQIPRLLASDDQEFYLVQEFIVGQTLTSELQQGQKWTEKKVIEMLQDVLGVLDFIHTNGVIHRDLKPDNLIRRQQDRRLVLIDFGAVKQIRHQLSTHVKQITSTVAIGTPGYMPAEQGQGKPRPNSDIYALGVIAIQAITGLLPSQMQEDINTGEIIWQHQAQISPGLAEILTKMVRCYFKDRYQSATEVLKALQELANHYPTTQSSIRPKYMASQNSNQPKSNSDANITQSTKYQSPLPGIKALALVGLISFIRVPLKNNMVNYGLNFASLLGIVVYFAGIALCSLALVRPVLARYHDILFAQLALIYALILIFQGWRLDPILQIGQILLTGATMVSAVEAIRLRGMR